MNKTIKTKAVIFDRDEVIINTEPVIINSVKKAFKKLGFIVQEDFSKLIGRGPDIYKDYFPKEMGFNSQ